MLANRGRTTTSTITPAQASRSQAAPSGPIRSNSPTETARPSCTHSIEATAMPVPARAAARPGARCWMLMEPVQPANIVRVHVRFMDSPFIDHE